MEAGKARIVMGVETLKQMLGIPDAIEISLVSQTPDQHVADIVEFHLRGPGLMRLPPATIPAMSFFNPPRDRPLSCDVSLVDMLREQFPDIPDNDLSQPEERTRHIELDAPSGT